MDDKENLSIHPTRKSWIPQPARKTGTNNSLTPNISLRECLEKTNSESAKEEGYAIEFFPKAEETSGKKRKNSPHGVLSQRPNTVSGEFRKKSEFGENYRNPTNVHTRKSSSAQFKRSTWDRRSIGGGPIPGIDAKDKEGATKSRDKTPPKNRTRIAGAEDSEPPSLLSRAIYEHGLMIKTLHAARKELRKKMVMKIKSKPDKEHTGLSLFLESSNPNNFENSYSGVLEEIFQAWVNLFYFIINLKVGLPRVFDCAGTESFAPTLSIEDDIIGKALECVKFFSSLKIKLLVCLVDDLRLPDDHGVTEKQLTDFEERISSPFLCEMDFVQKKVKEMLKQTKKVKQKKKLTEKTSVIS